MSNVPVITVDGPSGTGKGTVCQRLAQTLGWHFLDSGALYRVVGLAAQRAGVSLVAEQPLAALAANLDLRFVPDPRAEHGMAILLNGGDVSAAIRTEEAGGAASRVAAFPSVRAALLKRQRAFRQPPGLVADGRDMGTVVFPDAALKLFLTASPEERARRRHNQLKQKGIDVSLRALLEDILARDERDRGRAVSPLIPAADAKLVDTTALGIEAVIGQVMRYVREQGLLSS
ncbi:MAG TPA: (d)CMP kinase [Gammaproteobacteria bacterium]|nr:(d)CMP kinase [Gammaproteobacteria bacterium]